MPSMGLWGTGIVFSEETPVCVDGQGLGGTGIVLPEEAPLCVDGQGLGAFSSARSIFPRWRRSAWTAP